GVVLVLGVAGWVRSLRGVGRRGGGGDRGEGGVMLCGLVLLLLIAVSGLGGKPRSALVVIPLLAPAAGLGMERLRGRVRVGLLVLLGAWSAVGAAHLLGRYGLVKAGMNDRPEEVVEAIAGVLRGEGVRRSGGQGGVCGVVVTYDSGLAFRMAQAKVAGVRIVSPYGGDVFGASAAGLGGECGAAYLFVVESYIDGSAAHVATYTQELQAAEWFVQEPRQVERLGRDPDAEGKRRLAGLLGVRSGARLPEFRYAMRWGRMDPGRYGELVRALPHFYGVQE
ncbi:MAG: hypothetical protein M3O02_02650, partial [Acidobacteriota bacterium]|nr:hypothetical protein [Acidobacteriota bacterium]